MPNWCSTTVFFYSKDRNAVQDLKIKLEKIYKAPATVENGFREGWLGDFVNTLLVPEYHTDKDNCPECRGSIYDSPECWSIEKTQSYWYFRINTQTAWGPMLEMWYLILEKHYPGMISIAYVAEECGMGFYEKCDPDDLFAFSQYILDLNVNNEGGNEDFGSIDEVIDYLSEIVELGITREQLEGKTLDEINEIANNAAKSLSEDNWAILHEYREAS